MAELSQPILLEKFKSAVSTRCHENVVRYGIELLTLEHELKKSEGRSFGNERWNILERVLVDSGVYNLEQWMLYCFSELRKKFPTSFRLKRFAGCIRESLGDHQEALDIYSSLIAERPEDGATRKRLIALYKSAVRRFLPGRNSEAIAYLNNWLELAEIYVNEGCLPQALFCYEELILQDSQNICYIISYAEVGQKILASTGDYSLSIDYYSMALTIEPNSIRALWGLLRTWSIMNNEKEVKKHSSSSDGEVASQRDTLVRLAAMRLRNIYKTQELTNEWTIMCLDLLDEYI